MAAIQFYGEDAVITAFSNRGVDTWSISQGSDINATGSGEADLRAYLQLLAPAGSAAVYKLKVYSGITDPDTITNKTEYNAAFNFRLSGAGAVGAIPGTGSGGYADPIFAALHKKYQDKALELMNEDMNGGAKPKGIIGTITDLIENDPETLVSIIGKLKQMFFPSPNFGPVTVPIQPPRMAGTTQTFPNTQNSNDANMSPDEKMQRIAAALDTLERYDPKLLPHLEALANLAQTDPALFNSVIKKLDLIS